MTIITVPLHHLHFYSSDPLSHSPTTMTLISHPQPPIFTTFTYYSLSMKLEGASRELVGSDIEFPEFDPWGFTKNADENKMAW